MKTSWVFDIANGAVSILNQNGHWHKKLNRSDFRSLAGVGRRDVNIAPLFTASPVQTPAKSHQTPSPVEPMPDGRWYCPDCGTLNASSERFCKNCGKVR